jgi:hypothetical protein
MLYMVGWCEQSGSLVPRGRRLWQGLCGLRLDALRRTGLQGMNEKCLRN